MQHRRQKEEVEYNLSVIKRQKEDLEDELKVTKGKVTSLEVTLATSASTRVLLEADLSAARVRFAASVVSTFVDDENVIVCSFKIIAD